MKLPFTVLSGGLTMALKFLFNPELADGRLSLWAPVLAFVLLSSWNFGCQVRRLLWLEVGSNETPPVPKNPNRRPPCS